MPGVWRIHRPSRFALAGLNLVLSALLSASAAWLQLGALGDWLGAPGVLPATALAAAPASLLIGLLEQRWRELTLACILGAFGAGLAAVGMIALGAAGEVSDRQRLSVLLEALPPAVAGGALGLALGRLFYRIQLTPLPPCPACGGVLALDARRACGDCGRAFSAEEVGLDRGELDDLIARAQPTEREAR
jgi:hypothetical protein